MKKVTYENYDKIQNRIFGLKKYMQLGSAINLKIEFVIEKLNTALDSHNKFETEEQLSSYVMEDCDPLGRNECDGVETYMDIDEIRDIQTDIIGMFIPFSEAYSHYIASYEQNGDAYDPSGADGFRDREHLIQTVLDARGF